VQRGTASGRKTVEKMNAHGQRQLLAGNRINHSLKTLANRGGFIP